MFAFEGTVDNADASIQLGWLSGGVFKLRGKGRVASTRLFVFFDGGREGNAPFKQLPAIFDEKCGFISIVFVPRSGILLPLPCFFPAGRPVVGARAHRRVFVISRRSKPLLESCRKLTGCAANRLELCRKG